MTLDEKRKQYKCGNNFKSLDNLKTWPEFYELNKFKPTEGIFSGDPEVKTVDSTLNNRISVSFDDITTLEIDAIVNAANDELFPGGGVCGAIHRAAGKELADECRTLNGCDTGSAKITLGYRLPAKHVVHAVGPIGENAELLSSCYESCLELVKEHGLRSIAFPCISTGIYGYSSKNAAPVVLQTVRKWMENNKTFCEKQLQRIIFCLFENKDTQIYTKKLPVYFPVEDKEKVDADTEHNSISNSSKYF